MNSVDGFGKTPRNRRHKDHFIGFLLGTQGQTGRQRSMHVEFDWRIFANFLCKGNKQLYIF